MITYDFKGITIEAVCQMSTSQFHAARKIQTRVDRVMQVYVTFFDTFAIEDGNISDLFFVKSCTQYFLQSCWRHKLNSRIEFSKSLTRETGYANLYSLNFKARQKNNQHYLQVSLHEYGQKVSEIYLDAQEVIMLDAALGKALNLLSPKPLFETNQL